MVSESKLGCCKFCGSKFHRGWQCRENPKVQAKLNQPKEILVKPSRPKAVKHPRPKSDRRKLIKKFDAVFSQYIRKKAEVNGNLYCYVCGKKLTYETAVAMHYIGRRAISVRFNEDNVKVGCRDCNAITIEQPEILRLYGNKLGAETVSRLNELKTAKISTFELEELYKSYKNKLSLL